MRVNRSLNRLITVCMMPTPQARSRWFHLTPGRLLVAVLAAEVFLYLSHRLRWFSFSEQSEWTALYVAALAGIMLFVLLVWLFASLIIRWRYQFSIRSLLILAVVIAIPLGLLVPEIKAARDRENAVKAIRRVGDVFYDWQEFRFTYGQKASRSGLATLADGRRILYGG